jgi:hypothetical protein
MFLDEYLKYFGEYEKGARKICRRSSFQKIDKIKIELHFEKTQGNYDLYFNKQGLLLHSVHFETHKNYKIIYGYNRKGKLLSTIQLMSESNELLELSQFTYDVKGRISKEIVYSYEYNTYPPSLRECEHSYDGNCTKTLLKSSDDENNYCTFFSIFDNENKLIETKAIRHEDELMYWNKYEYDCAGLLKKEISLDENGFQVGLYEFLPHINGLSKGYRFSSSDKSYLREIAYEFNEKGHWITQVLFNDDEPRYFYEREIDYYM